MLLITHGWKKDHFGGRQQYSKCLIESINTSDHQNFKIYNINPYIKHKFFDKFFSLRTDNITNNDIDNILNIIKLNNIKIVIIDCSSFGILCKKIKLISKKIKIIIIHQHLEFIFFLKLFYNSLNIKNLIISLKMFINESLSSKYSDKQIFFTKRDLNFAKFFYKSKNTKIIPIAMPININNNLEKNFILNKPYLLFVGGGNLQPNFKGIFWFINNVLPKINLSLVVIGSDYDKIKTKNLPNVCFLGKVNNIAYFYKNAEFVIAPIFSGSGMKTKIAEAAAYGKTVMATKEALIGYEDFEKDLCIACNDENRFIDNIKNYKQLIKEENKIREIFNQNYSKDAMKINFSQLIKSLI